jgi:hypothetical protein
MLCADGNRVHLTRTVNVEALVSPAPRISGLLRVAVLRADGLLRWVANPNRPHLVFSQVIAHGAIDSAETDERRWLDLERDYLTAVLCDDLPTVSAGQVRDPSRFGTPGALPPHWMAG